MNQNLSLFTQSIYPFICAQYIHSSAHDSTSKKAPYLIYNIKLFPLNVMYYSSGYFSFLKKKNVRKEQSRNNDLYSYPLIFAFSLFFFVFFFNTLDVWWIPKIFDSVFMCFDSNNPVNWNSCVFLITILCVGTYLISSSKISSHFLILKRFFVFLKQVSNIWFYFCFVLFLVIWSLWDDVSLFCPWSSCPGLIFQARPVSRERVFV